MMKRKSCRILVVFGLAAAAAGQQSFSQSTVMVPMRDGVKLSTDVYLPAQGGPRFPALLVRTPYNKAGSRKMAAALTGRGYAVLSQDVRGRFESEGEFYPFVNEGLDGYDAIEWAAAQTWSNGQVGLFGGSYLAWDQYHAAMYRPPHLVAMFAVVGGSRFYDEYAFPGGIPNLGWARWILNSAMTGQQAARQPEAAARLKEIQKDLIPWLALPSGRRGDVLRDLPAHEKVYRDFFAHPEFDWYWKQRGFFTAGYYREMKDVPIFFLTGWYDYFAEGVLENFAELSKRQKTPKKLMVGPWPHGVGGEVCGGAEFGEAARLDQIQWMADWFDHTMRGREFRMKVPVRLFRMGGGEGSVREGRRVHGGEWREAPSWPPPGARASRYYLRAGGALTAAAPGKEEPSAYHHDPSNPVPTIGGRYDGLCAHDQVCVPGRPGCSDASPLNRRPDVLSFSTAPLPKAAEITGKAKARLWIASDAPSADFMVKLIDVYPDGGTLLLAEGQIRTKGSPGTPRAVDIPLEATSNWFGAGHRIRVDIASSSFPRSEPNPAQARNQVYHDRARASYIELPAY